MYTSDSITNSQRMVTEINKSGAIAKKKKKDSSEKWYGQTFKGI